MAHLPKAICTKCSQEYRVLKNGIVLEAMARRGDGHIGYYKVHCDLWICPTCDHKIYRGFAERPLAYHHEEGYVDIETDGKFYFYGE